MTTSSLPKTVKSCAQSLLGVAALSAIALIGVPQSAKAADTCGPGNHWVDNCTAGVDSFANSKAILDLWLWNPDGTMGPNLQLELLGPATVTRDNPVDALINDLDLGNVGIVNGHKGVIKTRLEEKFTGSGITLTGKGVGAIIEATESGINRPDLASSFFNVFAEVEGSFGKARNMNPIRVDGNKWLQGVPPSVIPPIDQPPPLPVAPDPRCSSTDPLVAIIYCGFKEVDFFAVDDKGEFIEKDGKKIKVATLHKEKHVVYKSVPEPSTAVASIVVGLGAMFGLKKKQQSQKA